MVSITFTIVAFISSAQIQRTVKPHIIGQIDSVSKQVKTPIPYKTGESARKDMIRELNLNREQKLKLKEFREQNHVKIYAITTDSTLSPDQKAAKLKELKRDQARNMQSILDPEQQVKMKAMQQEMMKKRIADWSKQND